MQIPMPQRVKKTIIISLILVAIAFLSYMSIQSFWSDVHYRRAKKLAANVKDWKQAAIEYDKALSVSPKNAEYHDEAGELYSKLAVIYQDDEWFNKALYHFKKSYQLNPYNAWAHYHLAWCYWNRKMYVEASEESKEAIGLDPNNATYHWQLAAIYEQMPSLEEALDEYNEVLRIMPHHSKAKEAVTRVEEKIQRGK